MRHEPIPPELFIENRRKLFAQLKPRSVAILQSNDVMPTSADGVLPFVQQSDLFYLTGMDQEETVLVLCPDAPEAKHREFLFIRETSEDIAVWEGPKYTRAEAARMTGIATVYWTREFERIFRPLALSNRHLYLNTNEHSRADAKVETRDDRFRKWCREIFPLHVYERLAPIMHALRPVKSGVEIDLIRRACGITAGAFERLSRFVRPGVWEYEIEAEITHEFLMNRSAGPAFSTIVASGENACILHYVKNDRQCREGELVLVDFGAEYAHYAADVTRTLPVNGRFTERQKDVYRAVLRIQRRAMDLLRPGNLMEPYAKELGRVMEEELVRLGLLDAEAVKTQDPDTPLYRKYCPHGISHHLGLDVHDYGDKERPFEAGMVFTCEPGIYIREENIGIRLENDILITEAGPVDLTAGIPIEVEDIEARMNQT